MVHKLCTHYGPVVANLDGIAYHDFPPPKALTSSKVEQHLRELGFGYRAKYLHKTATMIEERGMAWLDGLRNPESPLLGEEASSAGEMLPEGREGYRHAHEQLLELQGVGPKVADCVCLFGLGWGEVVPVDTHVWQIAQRDYKFGKGKHSSLTKATYDAIADKFRALWGKEAGWAHSVLFTADLRVFSERLVEKAEVKTIKMEDEDVPMLEIVKKETKVTKKRVKAEPEAEETKLFDFSQRSARATKRKRKT
jgi:N-glycosylase/DNA lyase